MKRLMLLLCLSFVVPQWARAEATLPANAGPSDNGGALGSAIFFNLQAATGIVVTSLTTASNAAAGTTYSIRIHTLAGTALGGPVGSGPGSSPAGWQLHGTVVATQGSGEVSLRIAIPPLRIAAGETRGIALEFVGSVVGPRYMGTGAPSLQTFSNNHVTLTTGDARSVPFTTTGSFFSSRGLVGSIGYQLEQAVLSAHPGPSNNSNSDGAGLFFNLQSASGAIVTGLTAASSGLPNSTYQIEVHTRSGSALGNTTAAGPGTSSAGWTLRGVASVVRGVGEISLPIRLPELHVPPGQILGVALVFRGADPFYHGTGSSPHQSFGDANLTIVTGEAMNNPFTTGSTVFSSRALVGSLTWHPLTQSLAASHFPSDNGGVIGSGTFMNVSADAAAVVNGFRTATIASANSTFTVQMYTRNGSTLGGGVSTGPTSSPAGWTLHATVTATQAATGDVSLPITIPALPIAAGQTVGVALVFPNTQPRYRGTGVGVPVTYGDPLLKVTTGEARSAPFTTTGAFFVSRELVGDLYFTSADIIFRNGFD